MAVCVCDLLFLMLQMGSLVCYSEKDVETELEKKGRW